jgi:hypothetical protein
MVRWQAFIFKQDRFWHNAKALLFVLFCNSTVPRPCFSSGQAYGARPAFYIAGTIPVALFIEIMLIFKGEKSKK